MSTMKFTSWQDLDGNEVANSAYPPGLVLIKQQTIGTAVTSVTVNDVFSSAFDNYRIIINDVTGSTPNALNMRLGSQTGSVYKYVGWYQTWASSTLVGYGPTTDNEWDSIGRAATSGLSYSVVDLFGPYKTQDTYGRSSAVAIVGTEYSVELKLWLNDGASYTSFVVKPNTGSITGGTIRVYGYNQ